MKTNFSFDASQEVRDLGLRGAYFVISGLANSNPGAEFLEFRRSVIETAKSNISPEVLNNDSILRGFRDLHDRVGASNRKHVAASENLLIYMLRTGDAPHISPIVDLYNLVSIETKLALGAQDMARVEGNIHLKLTSGHEKFVPLGSLEAKPTRKGVYAYIDDADDVLCYLEVRQVEKTKVTDTTTECFYIVQGNAATPSALIDSAMQRIIELTLKYCGGRVTYSKLLT